MTNKIPQKFLGSLSSYGPQIYDGNCGKTICWGYRIIKHLGEERFGELQQYGDMECIYPSWFLITKKLTREEAEKKYGKITDEEFGPRGGWKSVTFGKTNFISKHLRD